MNFLLRGAGVLAPRRLRPGSKAPPSVSPPRLRWRTAMARSLVVRSCRPWAGLATCLLYHRVCRDEDRQDQLATGFAPNRALSVRLSAFDAQMAFVARHFNCLSLPEAVRRLASGTLPERSLVVTFDDGYLDNLTLALPILRKHSVPATVYIATGLIDMTGLPWWYELEQLIASSSEVRLHWHQQHLHFSLFDAEEKTKAFNRLNRMIKLMDGREQSRFMQLLRQQCSDRRAAEKEFLNHDQLRELADDPLIHIGAHSHRHLALSTLDPVQLHHEIKQSKDLLEDWLKRPVEHLAYPFGGQAHASRREFDAAAKLGFASAVTTRLGHVQKFHKHQFQALPRIGIDYEDCMARFEWKLSGLYSLFRRPLSRLVC